jgi:hypothetical protein
MNINWLDWFGYIASLIILISLVSTSIIKLRLINTVGALLFAIYGLLIGSIPTAAMNGGIVLINIYYLYKIYSSKEKYQLVDFSVDSKYFQAFLDFYKEDIQYTFKQRNFVVNENYVSFYVLRDMVPASAFIAKPLDDKTLSILLDFATPAYRDFKIGRYLYQKHTDIFTDKGYKVLTAEATTDSHKKYLLKMGFTASGSGFIKNL